MVAEDNAVIAIVSGGQTGVDRGALDAALEAGVPCGGWCPRGRRAEDGAIPERYPMREMRSAGYPPRTRANVRDSDGTLVLCRAALRGGTALTVRMAREEARPCRVVRLGTEGADPAAVASWVRAQRIARLNVAGPRESEAPGLQDEARRFVAALLRELRASVA